MTPFQSLFFFLSLSCFFYFFFKNSLCVVNLTYRKFSVPALGHVFSAPLLLWEQLWSEEEEIEREKKQTTETPLHEKKNWFTLIQRGHLKKISVLQEWDMWCSIRANPLIYLWYWLLHISTIVKQNHTWSVLLHSESNCMRIIIGISQEALYLKI